MSKRHNSDRLLHIATLGRTVGLGGEMKLHLFTDFPEQFQPGETFFTKERTPLTLQEVNLDRGIVKLEGIDTPEAAKRFTNVKLFTTYGRTREICHLGEGQYFWFDLVGSTVMEDEDVLGQVLEIERIGAIDYFVIKTDDALVAKGHPKQFLLPYQPHFIVDVDIDAGIIRVQGGLAILEAS